MLEIFHPAVRSWMTDALGAPTPPQARAWPVLKGGGDALVAAPTGSGKTLAAFLSALDDLARDAERGALADEVRVVYVSPLKALSNDVHKNLMLPLEGIRARLGAGAQEIRAAVRTGDTPAKERAAVLKRPPHVLVTTPESLFVLLGSASGKRLLSTARTVIVDEIHAVAGTRRGAHLALTIERLEESCGRPLQRIGLSATQKPVEEVARLLVGAARVGADGAPRCSIIDEGHTRHVDVAIEVPNSPLEAVMSGEVWTEVFGRLAELVKAHGTTLVFVNTRRLAERVAAQLDAALKDSIGAGLVSAHHGSMSRDKRLDAEQRLKAGQLRALVATASLELGIDVGSVDLVCQIGATKSIAALLQRIGRANHQTTGTPKGRIFPLSRDELIEACALVDAITKKDLDALTVPPGGLDVLAQQLVAHVADEESDVAALAALARRSWPYRGLTDKDFSDVLSLSSEGVRTHRGRRGAHIFVDRTTGRVRGRKGARLAALTSGGAIPDQGDYVVMEEPAGHVVGTINEDFAIESMAGDVFQLGTTSWRILRVEKGTVRVEDAKGQPPSIPFWLGEAPARTRELGGHVSALRAEVDALLEDGASAGDVADHLARTRGLERPGALQMALYLEGIKAALGIIPTEKRIVFERFHDELGGAQIVVHAPLGGRVMRAWGLALRKRFCRSFDFELQAAATEDALLLSVGAVSDVDLTALPKFLTPRTARPVLIQAVLDAPMFGTRFRWNATRALTMLRMRGGKRIPPGIQRIEAQDLLVSLFPEQQACLENIVGDREIPDAVLIRQTLDDCLHEVMDIDGLERVLTDMENGAVEVRCVESTHPSPLAHEILAAKPYAFLDDAPLEERRVQAVFVPRGLDGAGAPLDPLLVEEVLQEIHPPATHVDEAHDALSLAGFLFDPEAQRVGGAAMPALLDELCAVGRARKVPMGRRAALVSVERATALAQPVIDADVLLDVVRARLEVYGPRPPSELVGELAATPEAVLEALARLERTGEALRGRFDSSRSEDVVWSKRLVTRVRRRMLERLRAQIAPVHAADLMRFLLRWQRLDVSEDERGRGLDALSFAIARLGGAVAPAAAWEEEILPRRVGGYDPALLDQLCFAGSVAWARLDAPSGERAGERSGERSAPRTLRATPISLVLREHLVALSGPLPAEEQVAHLTSGAAAALAVLRGRGASFFVDVARAAGLLPEAAEHALAELVAAGLVTADGFAGLRALLFSAKDREKIRRRTRGRSALVPGASLDAGGRWSVVSAASGPSTPNAPATTDDARAEAQARLLLQRFGVVFRKLVEREGGLLPWRDLLFALRRMEARGDVRGGRFVHGFSGEQFALPEVISPLRASRTAPGVQAPVVISAADPLNLTGILLPGPRVPAVLGHRLLFEGGTLVAVLDAASSGAPGGGPGGRGVRVVEDTQLPLGEIDTLLRRNPRASAPRRLHAPAALAATRVR